MQDFANKEPLEPSTEPLSPPNAAPRVSLEEMKASYKIMTGFKEAVEKCSFKGGEARDIALGLDFMGRMIDNFRQQIEFAKMQEKMMAQRTKESVTAAGGQIHEKPVSISPTA